MLALKLVAPSRKEPIVLDLTNAEALKTLKKDREFLLDLFLGAARGAARLDERELISTISFACEYQRS